MLSIAILGSLNKLIKKIQKVLESPNKNSPVILISSEEALMIDRDYWRISGLKDIHATLGNYYSDKVEYPNTPASGCIPSKELNIYYLSHEVPTDPIKGRLTSGCDWKDGMTFSYRKGKTISWNPYFVIGVLLERENAGNSDEGNIDLIKDTTTLIKWKGKYYYMNSSSF